MSLCGSFACGCGLTVGTGLELSGSGEPGDPWRVDIESHEEGTWTPTVTQSGAVAATITRATYERNGMWVRCEFALTVTGSGTGSNAIVIGGLPVVGAYTFGSVGTGYLYDSSGTAYHPATVTLASASTVYLSSTIGSAADLRYGTASSGFSAGLAVNDVLTGQFVYRAA